MSGQGITLVVCGGGLAGLMAASSLARNLGETYRIVLLEDAGDQTSDLFYGSVTAPTGYEFYRSIGLDEPSLFQHTATSFSFGTQYSNWPCPSQSWMQCHHQPFPVLSGVPLQHHLTRHGFALEPLLISAAAARGERFAHPPQDPASALSRAEYGYQFSANEWTALLSEKLDAQRVQRISGSIAGVETDGERIRSVLLKSGERIIGDLYLDCTGSQRVLIGALEAVFDAERAMMATHIVEPTERLGAPYRTVEAHTDGWCSKAFLQNAVHTLSVGSAGHASSGAAVSISLGRLGQAWRGNCAAIGTQPPFSSP